MAIELDALARCARYGLDPGKGLATQYLICESNRLETVPGMTAITVNRWCVHHGSDVTVFPLRDAKDRPFGAFIGIGVDEKGNRVGPPDFAAFNSKSLTFEKKFETYVSRIAGRFALLLDAGGRARLYLDPMGHMATFFNTGARLVGSSVFLTLDRPFDPGAQPMTGQSDLLQALPFGVSSDRSVRLMPGNHLLDLEHFSLRRVWPLRNTLRPVAAAKSAPVVDAMATRLRQVVGALTKDNPCLLEMDDSGNARQLLAATVDRRDTLAQVYGFARSRQDNGEPVTAARLCEAAGVAYQPLTREAALGEFGRSRADKQQRKRTFWLRTSCLCRVPVEASLNFAGLRKPGHLVLRSDGADALCVAPAGPGLSTAATIEFATGKSQVDAKDAPILSDAYETWRGGLPKSLQDRSSELIAMEWHQPIRAVALYGQDGPFSVSPFSDRKLMELALRLPADLRSGIALADAIVTACDPALLAVCESEKATLATAAE